MIKRPKSIYLVSFWTFIWLTLTLSPGTFLLKSYNEAGRSLPLLLQLLFGIWLVLIITVPISLILLRKTAVWIAIGIFAITSVFSIIKFIVLIPNLPNLQITFRFYICWIVILALNFICIWYLIRLRFRRICDQFREEKRVAAITKKLTKI